MSATKKCSHPHTQLWLLLTHKLQFQIFCSVLGTGCPAAPVMPHKTFLFVLSYISKSTLYHFPPYSLCSLTAHKSGTKYVSSNGITECFRQFREIHFSDICNYSTLRAQGKTVAVNQINQQWKSLSPASETSMNTLWPFSLKVCVEGMLQRGILEVL